MAITNGDHNGFVVMASKIFTFFGLELVFNYLEKKQATTRKQLVPQQGYWKPGIPHYAFIE